MFTVQQLLDIMGSLLERGMIKKDFEEKYPAVIETVHKELDMVKVIYDKQMEIKETMSKAAIHKNMPKVSGSLRWAQELRERISIPMGNFKHLEHPYVESDWCLYFC